MWRTCPKDEENGMWRIFQGNWATREISEITAAELSVLLEPLSSSLIILDLRRRDEVDRYPYIIPGALLTTNVDARALIGWLPSRSWVVMYATDQIPKGLNHLALWRSDLKFYALSGGLRAWWRDDLKLETIELYARGLRARQ
jgi:hypothetical protein